MIFIRKKNEIDADPISYFKLSNLPMAIELADNILGWNKNIIYTLLDHWKYFDKRVIYFYNKYFSVNASDSESVIFHLLPT